MEASSVCSYNSIVPVVLDHNNYKIWRSCMEDYLLGQDLWDVIVEAEPEAELEPERIAGSEEISSALILKPDHISSRNDKPWRRKNALALHAIKMSCSPSFLSLIAELKSAKEAWDILASQVSKHMEQSILSKIEELPLEIPVKNDDDDDGGGDGKVEELPLEITVKNDDEEQANIESKVEEAQVVETTIVDDHDQQQSIESKMEEPPAAADDDDDDDDKNPSLDEFKVEEPLDEASLPAENDTTDYDPFINALKNDDWSSMEQFLDSHPEALTAPVFHEKGRTALHAAIANGQHNIVSLLVDRMTADDLQIEDANAMTAFALAANQHYAGLLPLMELMIKKNPKLPNIVARHIIPVVLSSWKGCKENTRFLYHATDKDILSPEQGKIGVMVLIYCIYMKLFDIALELVEKYPKLLLQQDYDGMNAIHALAKTLITFPRRNGPNKSSRCSRWLSTLGVCIKYVNYMIGNDDERHPVSDDENLIYDQALAFLQLVGTHVSTWKDNIAGELVCPAMMEAAKNGTIELINEMLKANSEFLLVVDDGKSIFDHAIENRQENVFNLIYGVTHQKNSLLSRVNVDKNNVLHLAANLAPPASLNRSTGAALQIQRELQWFMEVENVARSRYRQDLNKMRLTPRELFTRNHEKLMEAGEKSIKETAQSSTVVGALIVTIMFGATFTAPGGYNQDIGLPLFPRKVLFKIFIVSDALSLYSSTTSILVFLGLLTSRYAENDFLVKLPRKLMIGLSTLCFSISTMMVTFCTALTLMLDGQLQFILPIVLLACVPIILFLSSILPLLHEIFMSTFGPSIFDRNTKLPSVKKNKKVMIKSSSADTKHSCKKECEVV